MMLISPWTLHLLLVTLLQGVLCLTTHQKYSNQHQQIRINRRSYQIHGCQFPLTLHSYSDDRGQSLLNDIKNDLWNRSSFLSTCSLIAWSGFGLSKPLLASAEWSLDPDQGLSLKQPTKDQPQIPFPDASTLENRPIETSLQGLLYLKNPKSDRRPTTKDVIILTVRTVEKPDIIISGAILPVSRIPSFPVQFRLNEMNAISPLLPSLPTLPPSTLSPQENWKRAMVNNDLLVQAVVCDRDTVMDAPSSSWSNNLQSTSDPQSRREQLLLSCPILPTSPESKPLSAIGVAKLIRYSDQPETGSSSVILRAPVALPLT